MKRYWRNEAATAATMLDGDWLRTGDGGSFDEDGYLYLHDRLKDMIVSGGENVLSGRGGECSLRAPRHPRGRGSRRSLRSVG